MYRQQISPEEHQLLTDRHAKARAAFIGAVVGAALIALFMIAQELFIVAVLLGGGGAYGAWLLNARLTLLTRDLSGGQVAVYKGPVERKSVSKNSLEMKSFTAFVEGESQTLTEAFYEGVDEGDVVELHRGIASGTLLIARITRRLGTPEDATVLSPPCPYCGGPLDGRGECPACYPDREQTDPEGHWPN